MNTVTKARVGLNVGSGQRPFSSTPSIGWINVDVNPKWEPDVVADGMSMPMFESNTADYIVLHQVYEHFGLGEATPLVRECHRILKPGGSLIVTTPNLDALCRAWITGKIDDYIFCVNLYGAYMDDEADRHKWLYTQRTLHQALKEAVKWRALGAFDWRSIDGADIARDFWILGAEGVK